MGVAVQFAVKSSDLQVSAIVQALVAENMAKEGRILTKLAVRTNDWPRANFYVTFCRVHSTSPGERRKRCLWWRDIMLHWANLLSIVRGCFSRRAAHPSVITQTARTEYILRRHRQTDTTVDTDRQSIAIHTVPLGPGVPVPVPVPVRTYLDLYRTWTCTCTVCTGTRANLEKRQTVFRVGWVGLTDSLVCQPPSPLCICCVFARRPKTQCILCICYPYPVYFPSRTPRRGYLYDL